MSQSANKVWAELLQKIIEQGERFSPRNMVTAEIIGNQTVVDMSDPVVTIPERKMLYKFLFGEAWWIVAGRKDVASIAPYCKNISNFSDDGVNFDGAYGPMVSEQLRFVCDTLKSDPDSRQALMTIWRPNPRPSKDIPCTVALQFFVRNMKIHCNATMRSSDAWLGWVYDVFNFTCVTEMVRLLVDKGLALGDLTLTAGSQHLYEKDWMKAGKIVQLTSIEDSGVDLNFFKKRRPWDSFPKFLHFLDISKQNPDIALNYLKDGN